MRKLLGYIGLPFLLGSFHWLSVRFYADVCVPDTLTGYLWSFLTTSSPLCVFVLTLIEKTSSLYLSSWIFLTMGSVELLKYLYNYLIQSPSLTNTRKTAGVKSE